MNSISKTTGNYLCYLGYASLLCMISSMVYHHTVSINLTFVLLIWTGSELKRKNPAVRKWVMRLASLAAFTTIAVCVYAWYFQSKTMSINFFGISLKDIELWVFYLSMGIVFCISVVPVYLLGGKIAKQEFAGLPTDTVTPSSDGDNEAQTPA